MVGKRYLMTRMIMIILLKVLTKYKMLFFPDVFKHNQIYIHFIKRLYAIAV